VLVAETVGKDNTPFYRIPTKCDQALADPCEYQKGKTGACQYQNSLSTTGRLCTSIPKDQPQKRVNDKQYTLFNLQNSQHFINGSQSFLQRTS
jgi:hypothetical protein